MPWAVKKNDPSCARTKSWGVRDADGTLVSCHSRMQDATAAIAQLELADAQDGAMLALVPSAEDAARLVLTESGDGEALAEGDLHLTLTFLGDAGEIPSGVRENIIIAAKDIVAGKAFAVSAQAWAHAVFNPAENPATVVIVGSTEAEKDQGEAALAEAKVAASAILAQARFDTPTQHIPWIPHVTLAMGDVDVPDDRIGPVVFDRLRVAFGGDVTDIPLQTVTAEPAEESEDSEAEDTNDTQESDTGEEGT